MSALLEFVESRFGNRYTAADIADHFQDKISQAAADFGIDWSKVQPEAKFSPHDSKIKEKASCRYALEAKDRGKVAVWVRSERHESGVEYPFITFNSFRHGQGCWSGWQDLYDLYQREQDLPVSAQQVQWQQQQEDRRKQREIEQAVQLEKEKAQRAKDEAEHQRYHQMYDAAPADDGLLPYFCKKQISAVVDHITVKRCSDDHGEFSALALIDIDGNYKGLQRLYEKKKLQTVAVDSGQFNAAFCIIGCKLEDLEENDDVILVEGFATGASVFLATGTPVIVCISADNLIKVAQAFQRKMPSLHMVVATDNDINKNGNTGLRNGLYLAKEIKLRVVYPTFDDIDPTAKPTDFNDVHVNHKKGLKEVTRQLKARANKLRPEQNWFEYCLQRLFFASKERAQQLAIDAINAGLKLAPVRFSVKEVCQKVYNNLPTGSKIDRKRLKQQVKWLSKLKIKQAQEPRSFSNLTLAKPNVNYIQVQPEIVDGREELPSNIMDTINRLQGVVIVRAPMATGKTDKIIGKIFSGHHKALYLAHRVSLVGDASSRLKATNYQEVIPDMVQHLSRAAICVNSIINPKYKPFFQNLDAVCIDEAAQTLRHISSGESVDSPVRVLDALMGLIRDSKQVLMCDADANDALVDLAEAARPGETIHIIEMKVQKTDLKILSTDYDSAFQMVIDSVAKGQKVLVPTDSATTVDALATKLKAENKDLKVLAIHADCKGEHDVTMFLADANAEVRKYDVVIYSPAISSGLSMKHKAHEPVFFDRVIGMFGGTVTPSDALQMLRRYRNAREFVVGLKPRSLNQETDREHIWLGMIEADKLVTRIDETEDEIAIIRKKHIFDDARVTTIANERKSRKDFANNMLLIAAADGWTIENLSDDEETKERGKESRSLASKAAKQAHVDAVLSSPDIDDETAQSLSRQEMKTRQESIKLERYQIRSHFCVDQPGEDDVVFWKDRGVNKVHLFELLQAEREQAEKYDQFERENRVMVAVRKRKVAKHETLERVFNTLGIDRDTGEGQFNKVQAQELMNYFYRNEQSIDLFNTLHLGAQISRFSQHRPCAMTFAKNILANIGLTTKVRRPTVNGQKITVRSITEESWETMTRYAEQRKSAGVHSLTLPEAQDVRQSAPETEVAEDQQAEVTTSQAPLEQGGQTLYQLGNSNEVKSVHMNLATAAQFIYRCAEAAGLAGADWTVYLATESVKDVQEGLLREDQLIRFFEQYVPVVAEGVV